MTRRVLFVLVLAALLLGAVAVVRAQDSVSRLVVLDQIERERRAMRTQVEQCQPVRLPTFVALPALKPGSQLLIDAWGSYEVRAVYGNKGWTLKGINPACPQKSYQ